MDSSTVSPTDVAMLRVPITLTNCDREPIHIPGAIQPYGFVLCLDPATRRIVHASANTETLIGRQAESLLGGGLDQLLGSDRRAEVDAVLDTLGVEAKLVGARLDPVAGQPFFKIVLHRYDDLLWLEFEPVSETDAAPLDLPFLNAALGQMLAAGSVLDFCQHAVEQVRGITGFDRVAIYRFAPDESGEIIAEARHADLPPWLGMHYPATDIPQQARAMYLKNWLRFIADARYVPVPLVPARHPTHPRPPDMTHAMLRSVSPIHLEYLHNIGSAATMTISLIQDNQLWGMITCHHRTPRLVSYELRELCQFIGKTFSALLPGKELHDTRAQQLRIREQQAHLFAQVSRHPNFVDGLHREAPTVMDVFDCGGAAICFDDEVVTVGVTPTPAQIRELLAWLQEHAKTDVFYTNSYAALNPAGLALRATASGFIAASLTDAPSNYLLWFRPEVVQTVTWAGRNDKPQVLANGQIFLSPRQSFEAWKQLVENTSAPWQPMELAAARDIRLHISDLRLKVFNELQARAHSLARLNTELERSNDELDSFAYVASHDLKEPLRGIHNYSLFLLEDYADRLDAEGVHKLETLVRLSQRMESLIESLLQLSRVGRTDLVVADVDPHAVLADVADLLQPRFEQTHTTLTVAGPLPTVRADRVRLQEVLYNLISNGMKYNDQPAKTVTVGLAPAEAAASAARPVYPADFHVFYVRDNGIGIDARHQASIFQLFKRLHPQERYGGGTGAGLAIAKKMVEKHGGSLWVESAPGEGATFYFTLPMSL
ncbi:ATP-binding protein [Hymenobacter sp. B1770]|uniref:ATP-binding protein n=1 Tax=Hymenobacter sp. B1770 TaxID=1718788 RepID=UPI003CF36854